MGRMHTKGKGISSSTVPYNKVRPSWVTKPTEEIVAEILNLAKKGYTPCQIGSIMRDEYGIGQVPHITKTKILMLLKMHGLAPKIPEDLNSLLVKCSNIRNHLSRFTNDKDSKYRLILVESRLHRIARYYKRKMMIPASWKPNFLKVTGQ